MIILERSPIIQKRWEDRKISRISRSLVEPGNEKRLKLAHEQ
ncbi:MAG: hypothetical protein ACHBN1_12010 [Heteroscytonema crispum UTEX LB 1556]